VLEEDLEGGAHGAALSKGKRPYDEVRGERRVRDRDYAARPFTTGRIHAVVLVSFPQSEGEGFQEGLWEGVRDVVSLCLSPQFGEIEVFPARAQPVAWENTRVSTCGLSIKLDG